MALCNPLWETLTVSEVPTGQDSMLFGWMLVKGLFCRWLVISQVVPGLETCKYYYYCYYYYYYCYSIINHQPLLSSQID
jgi:hypothetical protein